MSLTLVKRSTNGAAVTAIQNDANMTAIESAVNTNTTAIASAITTSSLNGMFASQSAGKQQIDWANVVNRPSSVGFYVTKTANQTISASGTVNITLTNEVLDIGNHFASNTFTAPVAGFYHFDARTQVELTSGSPTSISILFNLNKNGTGVETDTNGDGSGTGTRTYKISRSLLLAANDTITLSVDFSFTGTATWTVASSNTAISGFYVSSSTG